MNAVIVRPSSRSRQARPVRPKGCAFLAIGARREHFLRLAAFRLCHKGQPLM
jgi:hypothetical protein